MIVIVRKDSLRRVLKWSRRLLFACAVLLLGYCGFALVDARIFQKREGRELERLLSATRVAGAAAAQPAASGLIGRIQIPRLGLSLVVVEGIDEAALRRAAGHIPGTALPGEAGNAVLAGHRDTFFRPLKDIRVGDEIQFSTLKGNFRYQVVWRRIVDPDEVGVLAPSGGSVLTLVTCYPFYYIGPAPKRWIVRAKQMTPLTAASSTVK